jgi:hypothetical protein
MVIIYLQCQVVNGLRPPPRSRPGVAARLQRVPAARPDRDRHGGTVVSRSARPGRRFLQRSLITQIRLINIFFYNVVDRMRTVLLFLSVCNQHFFAECLNYSATPIMGQYLLDTTFRYAI